MKKRYILLLFLFVNVGLILGQCINNPSIQGGDINPSPLTAGEEGVLSFSFSENGLDYTEEENDPVRITICLLRIAPKNGALSVGGTFASFFDWQYNTALNCILGTQNQDITGGTGGSITVEFIQTNPIDCPDFQMGFNANIQPAVCMNGVNQVNDDNESAFTCVTASMDTDGDGIDDDDEITNGSDPTDPCDPNVAGNPLVDCDGDGINNGEEIANGSDPADICSPLSPTVNPTVNYTLNTDCSPNDLMFTANVTAALGTIASYEWTGPNGFTSFAQNPILNTTSEILAGIYSVQVTDVNGCQSPNISTEVVFNTIPEPPVLSLSEMNLCQGEELLLSTTFYQGNTVEYTWNFGNDSTITTTEPNLYIEDVELGIHDGLVSVAVSVDGCSSANSLGSIIDINAFPQGLTIYNGTTELEPACSETSINLSTDFVAGATYSWTGPDGFTSTLFNPSIEGINSQNAGTYFLTVSMNDCMSEVMQSELYIQTQPEIPEVINEGPFCENSDLVLWIVNPKPEEVYTWYRQVNDEYVGTGTELIIPNISTINAGGYYAMGQAFSCISSPSAITNVVVDTYSMVQVQVGDDMIICEDSIQLVAVPLTEGEGLWYLLDEESTSTIVSPSSASSMVTNLQEGENYFVWAANDGACGLNSTDTLMVNVDIAPNSVDDTFMIGMNEALQSSVILNDAPNATTYSTSVLQDVELGELSLQADGSFIYTPNENALGIDIFTYEVCQNYCPDNCTQASVTIKIDSEAPCQVPNLFTPNGDGWNDTFTIPCLELYPGSTLCVFNRWGDQILVDKNYQNDWEGNYNFNPLPAATYFYILEINDNEGSRMSGFMYIQR